MNLFGLAITRAAQGPTTLGLQRKSGDLVTRLPTDNYADSWNYDSVRPGWFPVIREGFPGAWQRGITASVTDVLAHGTAWSCITLIARDIAKLRPMLVEEDEATGVSEETSSPAYSPVLTKPNHYQNRIQFYIAWLISKLTRGNTYVLKERDSRNVVTDLHVLDPNRVQVLVAPDGQVYYQLGQDLLAGITGAGGIAVPAREIIHDTYVTPYHPLCGVSPITAAGLAISQGLRILESSEVFFRNGAQPSGVLVAPQAISQATMDRLEKYWNDNFAGGRNVGKVAALGDGLKFEQMAMTAVDAQLIDQLNWGDKKVASVYHVPGYMVGVEAPPNYNNIEALNQQYYSQCLQSLIEELELCLEEGLGATDAGFEIEFDIDGLLRLDSATKMTTAKDGVAGGILAPNEARAMFNQKPVEGGDSPYLQQQNFSLSALNRRDQANPAPSSAAGHPAPAPSAPVAPAPAPAAAPAKAVDADLPEDAITALTTHQIKELLVA